MSSLPVGNVYKEKLSLTQGWNSRAFSEMQINNTNDYLLAMKIRLYSEDRSHNTMAWENANICPF